MPDMSGIEVSRAIRQLKNSNKKNPIIIAVTAYALKGDKEKFLFQGMDDYISKPIDIIIFNEVLKKKHTERPKLTEPTESQKPKTPEFMLLKLPYDLASIAKLRNAQLAVLMELYHVTLNARSTRCLFLIKTLSPPV